MSRGQHSYTTLIKKIELVTIILKCYPFIELAGLIHFQ